MIPFEEILANFKIEGMLLQTKELSGGKINHTYQVRVLEPHTSSKNTYILQQINNAVFQDPEDMLAHSCMASDLLENGIQIEEELFSVKCPNYMESVTGKRFWCCGEDVYRLYPYVDGDVCTSISNLEQAERLGEFAGKVGLLLQQTDVNLFSKTLPGFHDVVARYEQLEDMMEKDPCGRLKDVWPEVDALMKIRERACCINREIESGNLPLRVVHSDMKSQNILWDEELENPIGILDLDSVMAGTLVFDYGDLMRSVRKGVDSSHIWDVQNAIHEGYVRMAGEILTEEEEELLKVSEYCISAELAVRYLTDYLAGDVYFKTVDPDDNIRSCRELIDIVMHDL